MRRRYKQPRYQALYEYLRRHPPIRQGRRYYGAHLPEAYWKGYDNLRFANGEPLFIPDSPQRVAWVAGRDNALAGEADPDA